MSQQELPPEEQVAPLREYVAIFRVRKWWIVSVTLLTFGGAILYSLQQTPIYESSARVLVKPIALSPTEPGAVVPVNLETERGLGASVPVAEEVVRRLNLTQEPRTLLGDLTVEVVATSEFLVFRYRHPDPLEAQRRAQSFANAYLDFRREQAVDDALAAAQAVQARIESVQDELEETNVEIRRTTDPSEEQALESQADLLVSQLAVLQQQLSQTTPQTALQVGQIVEPASPPSSPVSPNLPLNAVLAVIFGLGLGIGLAFLRERLDDSLRGRPDLEAHAGAPVLAVIPKVVSWRRDKETPVVTLTEPKSAASEAYRTLRTSLLFLASQQDVKTIIVTSAHPDEGKTATVANLAATLAQAGKRVVAISADLRKPRLHRFYGIEDGQGLTNVLAGEARTPEVLSRPGLQSLRLVHSGRVPGNPSELLGSEQMGEFLAELREVADFVLIDTAPVLAVADALTLSPFADAVLLVADAEKTSRGAVAQARQQLDQVNANVVGAVLNNFDPSKAKGAYYYQYYYVYEERDRDRGGHRRGRPRVAAEASRDMWSS